MSASEADWSTEERRNNMQTETKFCLSIIACVPRVGYILCKTTPESNTLYPSPQCFDTQFLEPLLMRNSALIDD